MDMKLLLSCIGIHSPMKKLVSFSIKNHVLAIEYRRETGNRFSIEESIHLKLPLAWIKTNLL